MTLRQQVIEHLLAGSSGGMSIIELAINIDEQRDNSHEIASILGCAFGVLWHLCD